MKVIENAKEIHCLDSSISSVERTKTNADLFFHNIKKRGQRGAEVHLVNNWQIINYSIRFMSLLLSVKTNNFRN